MDGLAFWVPLISRGEKSNVSSTPLLLRSSTIFLVASLIDFVLAFLVAFFSTSSSALLLATAFASAYFFMSSLHSLLSWLA